MSQDVIHVYFMPGMAASTKIFEYIRLPENQFKIHYFEWLIPFDNESLSDYALRMSKKIEYEDCVLIGVSFGGVLVQEISKHIKVKKLIIISSVKSMNELPKKMLFAKITKAYKLLPVQLVENMDVLAKYVFGNRITKRFELYKKYLSVNNSKYLNWAIKNMVCWNQSEIIPNIIHIHGDNDSVFPISNIKNCIKVTGGTHIMILNKFKWFNENLPKLILG
ncbi:MAG: alpha/beta hydrolase [Flavobacteriaceae bacterium]|nr:alpha/beta hydrolase [Flavobacteriaceae bacterium]